MNNWRKSSYSFANGNCAEVASWRKSSHSAGGNCAEVRQDGTVIGMRDSKNPGPVLAFTPAAWAAFLAMVRQT